MSYDKDTLRRNPSIALIVSFKAYVVTYRGKKHTIVVIVSKLFWKKIL